MQAFTQIKDYENEFGSEMNVPSIVVIGVESAGKSTLLSAIVGVPLTFTQGNTGTRCPVRYRLRYGEDAKDPEVKVMGQVAWHIYWQLLKIVEEELALGLAATSAKLCL